MRLERVENALVDIPQNQVTDSDSKPVELKTNDDHSIACRVHSTPLLQLHPIGKTLILPVIRKQADSSLLMLASVMQ